MRTIAIMAIALALAGCSAFVAPNTQDTQVLVGQLQSRPACTSIGTTMYCQ